MSYLKLPKRSLKLYVYEDIPLKIFLEVITTGSFGVLCYKGKVSSKDFDKLVVHWEGIVKRNNEASGNFEYENYFWMLGDYAAILAQFVQLKAMLLKLAYVIDYEYITALRKKGYVINIDNSAAYENSIYLGLRKVENLITRATMKENELAQLRGTGDPDKKVKESYESLIAPFIVNGMNVGDNITLRMYNELRKNLKQAVKK